MLCRMKSDPLFVPTCDLPTPQKQSARERAALWLAVNKLDVMEAAKDAAIKDLQVCRKVLRATGFFKLFMPFLHGTDLQ